MEHLTYRALYILNIFILLLSRQNFPLKAPLSTYFDLIYNSLSLPKTHNRVFRLFRTRNFRSKYFSKTYDHEKNLRDCLVLLDIVLAANPLLPDHLILVSLLISAVFLILVKWLTQENVIAVLCLQSCISW